MPAPSSYSRRVTNMLADWALLSGDGDRIARDPRFAMMSQVMQDFDRNPGFRSALCADGSPLETCERISQSPQSPAFSVEPLVSEAAGNSTTLDALCSALTCISSDEAVHNVRQRILPTESQVDAYWIGVDFAQKQGVRIYCHLKPNASSGALSLVDSPLSGLARTVISRLSESGALRLIAWNFSTKAAGTKLAFSHPLDLQTLERIAGECGIPALYLSHYMRSVAGSPQVWRRTRGGVALAIDHAGQPAAITVYHYAAPHFHDDGDLRDLVLRLSDRFQWNVDTYRSTSKLLDRHGVRVRNLLGFTVTIRGEASLRIYGRSGIYK